MIRRGRSAPGQASLFAPPSADAKVLVMQLDGYYRWHPPPPPGESHSGPELTSVERRRLCDGRPIELAGHMLGATARCARCMPYFWFGGAGAVLYRPGREASEKFSCDRCGCSFQAVRS